MREKVEVWIATPDGYIRWSAIDGFIVRSGALYLLHRSGREIFVRNYPDDDAAWEAVGSVMGQAQDWYKFCAETISLISQTWQE